MLQDLKEAADKRRQERGAVLAAVSGRADFAARLMPHLTFDYSGEWVQVAWGAGVQAALHA